MELGNEGSGDAGNGGKPGNAARMVTVRRLRVSTVRTDSSPSVEVVAKAADPATVAAVLAHKVVSEARRRYIRNSRVLLCVCVFCAVWQATWKTYANKNIPKFRLELDLRP